MDSVGGKDSRGVREDHENFANECTFVDETGILLHTVERICLCFALHVLYAYDCPSSVIGSVAIGDVDAGMAVGCSI